MNNDSRKRIDAIIKDIENSASARDEINQMIEALNEKIDSYRETFRDALTAIEEIKDEEQEKFDNLSEGLQQSERGQNIESAVSALDTAYQACDTLSDIEDLQEFADADEIITALDEAKNC